MKCFYHSADLDGHCSGAIVKLAIPKCELYPIDYGYSFPWNEIKYNEVIYMVDYSLQDISQMKFLNSVNNLIWIDHHKSAIEQVYEKIRGIRNIDKAACELVWRWFYPNLPVPQSVHLLGRHDVWDHTNPKTYPFQMGMKTKSTDPRYSNNLWKKLLKNNNLIEKITSQGKTIVSYQKQQNAKLAKDSAFELKFQGLKFIAANISGVNSKFFDSIWDESEHDAMLTFSWRNSQWAISMYRPVEKVKDGIDLSKIAKEFGGGGHANACGFQCNKLPFKLS